MHKNMTAKKPRILVVGSMNMDLNVYDVQGIPAFGESVKAGEYLYTTGGKGANQAFAVARLGGATAMVGRVGQDEYGEAILGKLARQSVQTNFVVQDPSVQTGLASIFVNPDGRYTCYVAMGANNNISIEDVIPALDEFAPDLVMAQLEMPLQTVYRLHEETIQREIPLFLDAGPPTDLDLQNLQNIFLISPNEVETKALTGIEPVDSEAAIKACDILAAKTSAQNVILKLGAQGALIREADGRYDLIPAFNVTARDSTAAGDTFNAALAVKWCQGTELKSAVRYANAAAAICVSKEGAMSSIPRFEEVDEFLEQNC